MIKSLIIKVKRLIKLINQMNNYKIKKNKKKEIKKKIGKKKNNCKIHKQNKS